MDAIFSAVADVLQLIVQPCYALTGNWWISILLFTLITKVVLLPMSLWVQKNSIVMVNVMPEINRIKVKYYGDREAIGEKQQAVFKEKHYHPLLSMVPLLVQVIILFGLVDVIHSITDNGAPGTEFLGMVPVTDGGMSWIMPLLAGLSAVAMGFAQNRINPLQREQSRAKKNTTNGLSIGLSLILGVFVSAGMCFYWICSNLSSIAIQALMNICIVPAKHIDYEDLAASRTEIEALEALEAERKTPWWKRDPLTKRERADYKRFFKIAGKHIVFYSEGSGFYKYFKGAIDYLLANSDVNIHYITNDPNDRIFALAEQQPRIKPYYIGQKRSITLMMKMDADVVVSTLEDLDNYYIKRSYVRKDTEYVFMPHHMTSMHLTPSKQAYDHYDTVLCVGPHQVAELRREEQLYQLPVKNLAECGYDLLDDDVAAMAARRAAGKMTNERPVVIVAPSWQEDNLLDSVIDTLIAKLRAPDVHLTVRPHPEYVKRYGERMRALTEKYADVSAAELTFELDFSSNRSIYSSDLLITDWSAIAYEFCFSTKRPVLFVNTKIKMENPDYRDIPDIPVEISLRDEVGRSLEKQELADSVNSTARALIADRAAWEKQITDLLHRHLFSYGQNGAPGVTYILTRLRDIQTARKQAEATARKGK